jgi:outer membrane protein assembly factor BamB
VTCYSGYGLDKKNPGDPNQLRRHLICVDTADGKTRWDRSEPAVLPELPWGGRLTEHGYASQTPATDGKHVYAYFGKSGVLAYDLEGRKLWQQSVGVGSDKLKWGSAASLTLTEEHVLVNAWDESQTLFALDKRDGQPVWQVDLSSTGLTFSTPVRASLKGGREELILALPTQIWALDPRTGTKLWWVSTAMKGSIMGTPVIVDGVAYVHGGGPSGRSSMAVRCGGQGDVTQTHVLWTNPEAASVPTPVFHDGTLYWVNNDGQVFCQNARTGEVRSSAKLPVEGRFAVYASTIHISGHLYAVTRQHGTFVFAANPEYRLVAHNQFLSDTSDFSGTPAVSEGCLYLRSFQALYCLGEK